LVSVSVVAGFAQVAPGVAANLALTSRVATVTCYSVSVVATFVCVEPLVTAKLSLALLIATVSRF
jgi:hypothetical protein